MCGIKTTTESIFKEVAYYTGPPETLLKREFIKEYSPFNKVSGVVSNLFKNGFCRSFYSGYFMKFYRRAILWIFFEQLCP